MLTNCIAILNGKGGVGKCLAADSLVVDPRTGVPQTIADVVRSPTGTVLTFDGRFVTPAPIAAKVDSGRKATLRLRLASGRTITGTPHHPMLLPDGWRRLDEIRPGETVAAAARIPAPTEPERLPDAHLDLLAVLLAEGSTSTPTTRFSTGDPSILEIATEAAAGSGTQVRRYAATGYDYTLVGAPRAAERGPDGRPESVMKRFRRIHGLDGCLARHKVMPEAVWRLPDDQLRRFLTVFWMCDGYVTTRGTPEVALASQTLIEQLQHLLLRVGVTSRVVHKEARCDGKTFPSWRLTVYAQCIPAFAAAVPLWGGKGDRLRTRAAALAVSRGNPNVGMPSLSAALRERLYRWCPSVGRQPAEGRPRMADVAARLGWRMGDGHRNSPRFDNLLFHKPSPRTGIRRVSLRALRAFAEVMGAERELGWLYDGEIFWDEVVAVEDGGVRQVYDLTVPSTACFVANDLVVHNTSTVGALAGMLARPTRRVLALDLDPQGNLGRDLGYADSLAGEGGTALLAAITTRTAPVVMADVRPGLDVIPAGDATEDLQEVLRSRESRAPGAALTSLRDALATIAHNYSLVIVDCPPGNPLLQRAALAAATYVLVPTCVDDASIDGLLRVDALASAVRAVNPGLHLLGAYLFAVPTQAVRLASEARAAIADCLGGEHQVLDAQIRHAAAAARDCRRIGVLPHELELLRGEGGRHRAEDGTETRIAASASGLAGDYQALALEVVARVQAHRATAGVA